METSKVERMLSALLTLATIVVAAVVVEGRVRPDRGPTPRARVEHVREWHKIADGATAPLQAVGPAVAVTVFTDFQCPFCRIMDSVLTSVELKHPGRLGRSIAHFPIDGHQFAKPSAMAFECARRRGKAKAMHDVLYRLQDSLGRRPWSAFARDIGIRDDSAFQACVIVPDSAALLMLEQGLELGRRLRVSGTPAVVVDGTLFDPALPEQIVSAIEDALSQSHKTQRIGR